MKVLPITVRHIFIMSVRHHAHWLGCKQVRPVDRGERPWDAAARGVRIRHRISSRVAVAPYGATTLM